MAENVKGSGSGHKSSFCVSLIPLAAQDKQDTSEELEQTGPIYTENNIVTGRDMGGVGKYGCDQCNKFYSNQGNLYTHKQSKHEGMRYCCDQCDYKATRQDSLTIHKLSKHEGVQYECDQCDFKSAWKGLLTKHKQFKHK